MTEYFTGRLAKNALPVKVSNNRIEFFHTLTRSFGLTIRFWVKNRGVIIICSLFFKYVFVRKQVHEGTQVCKVSEDVFDFCPLCLNSHFYCTSDDTSLCGTFSESAVKSIHMTHAYPGVTVP